MINIINELNKENGSNYKLSILEKHKDNELFKRVLKMTYDNVSHTYGISTKNIDTDNLVHDSSIPLVQALDILEEQFCTRISTGNAAIELLSTLLSSLSKDDAEVLKMIVNRDLRINLGKTQINKVFKGLITKPPYMRCSLPDKIDRVKYPAIVQEKCDGTYRSLIVRDTEITLMGRSGEIDNFKNFERELSLSNLPNGVYIGELLLRSCFGTKDRMKANGLINSDTEQPDMYLVCWDYLTLEEFENSASSTKYKDRFETLTQKINESTLDIIEVVDTKIVNSYDEAMGFFKEKISKGLEGVVLKDLRTNFKNGTSSTQIKLKEEAVAEFIVKGFQEGEGRLKGTLGSLYYESSDELVQGKMGGFSDKMRDEIWNNQDKYLGAICSVKYNGISKAKGKDTYSLMFANFVEFRPEKDSADDYDYIKRALK